MMSNRRIIEECKNILKNRNTEEALLFLRRNGFDKIDSIMILVGIGNLSPSEAKKAVHFSETWRDARGEHEEFHRSLLDSITEMENDKSPT
jgi:hypothetical protein